MVVCLPNARRPSLMRGYRNLRIEVLFESDYVCMSAAENTINLEIPLDTLHRALRSCSSTADTSLRLTKRNNMAYLALASSSSVYPIALKSNNRVKEPQRML